MKKHFSLSKTIHFSEAVDSAILDWKKISEGKYHVRMCLSDFGSIIGKGNYP